MAAPFRYSKVEFTLTIFPHKMQGKEKAGRGGEDEPRRVLSRPSIWTEGDVQQVLAQQDSSTVATPLHMGSTGMLTSVWNS